MKELIRRVLLGFIGWLLFIIFFAAGVYDIIDPFILGGSNSTVGYILAVFGLIFPYLWSAKVMKMDRNGVIDFYTYSFLVLFMILGLAAMFLLPGAAFFLYSNNAALFGILAGGLILLGGAYISYKKSSGTSPGLIRAGSVLLMLSNLFLFISVYYLIGEAFV